MRNFRKMIAAFSMVAILSTFVVSTAFAGTYTDVPADSDYYAAVEALAAAGVLDTTKTTFKGTEELVRSEAAKLVVLAAGFDLENPATSTFADVAKTAWYYDDVETAVAHEVLTGYTNAAGTPTGKFGPTDKLTRAQYAKMLVNGLGLTEYTPDEPTFTDVPASHWAYSYVETAYHWSVVGGFGDGSFKPGNSVTRYQSAVMTNGAMNPVERGGSTPDEEEEEEPGDLEGGAGAITVTDLSLYTAEEVGEGEEEVPVMAFEVEADDGSDVQISSIKVELAQTVNTNSQQLDDYMSTVFVLFDGEVVGTADVEDFSETSDVYTKFISLDNVIVRAGETEKLTVALTALGQLDSGDIDNDAWTVDVLNVRFIDAEGVVTTEDTDADNLEQDFDFATYAASTDVELNVSLNAADKEEINDAHVINVDATDDTDDVEFLSFILKNKGDSDITLNDIPVVITSVEALGDHFDDPDDIVTTAHLFAVADEICGAESLGTGDNADNSETVTFDDCDLPIPAGESVEMKVTLDVVSLADALDAGDTLSVQITAVERALIDADDAMGDRLAAGDLTGTAVADASQLRDVGIITEFVSSSYSKTTSDTAGVNETVEFTLVYDVTAFDGDIYVDHTCGDEAVAALTTQTTVSADGDVDGDNTTCTSLTSTADEGNEGFLVAEGDTERFTVTILANGGEAGGAGTSVSFVGRLEGIGYKADGTDAAGDTLHTFGLTNYKSSSVTVFDR